YASYGGTWVVAGAPICAAERLADVAAELDVEAGRANARVLYFGAGERLEQLLGSSGTHHLLRLGAQPMWDATTWAGIVASKKSLRAQLNRARNKGVHVKELDAHDIEKQRPALRSVLDAWLGTRGLPALHFMTEPDMLNELRDRRVFVAEREARAIAF